MLTFFKIFLFLAIVRDKLRIDRMEIEWNTECTECKHNIIIDMRVRLNKIFEIKLLG